MKQTKLLNILAKVKSFPSMPGAAEKLLKLLDKPDTTAVQIEQILRYDPGLTANLLKLTNSVYFGLPCKVGSVSQAVVLLGWKKLIQLVMASCVNAIMGKPVPGYDLSAGELWRHSIAVSVAAEDLAKELKISAPENIFTAALLHDVGKLVLGSFVKEELEEIEIEASRGISFEIAEHMVLGTNHAEIGAQILKNWSFPPELVNAVRWHHD
ncbi:MAG: HDOD domain-containing protein, partial [Desulfobacterales bacterium]|nr:HDOD domain-containing protein [Desulfobacterales bacterium]